ncbi:NACHT domain-containing protein [Lysobacter enzymogenes]|uniref:NACHT domain-containing protein n=1 Tax=Lysobacter enzymogenes TaxID=69 RepID=UPI001117899A|nr:NACHT domain-containing protein [Lysobacter enzymogenes]UZW62925.1 NACHT domain-containing protein [Lysobacter enzymogenes]
MKKKKNSGKNQKPLSRPQLKPQSQPENKKTNEEKDSGLNEKTLPQAIGALFSLNNHDVKYSQKINGAEIDIVATPRGNPFAPKIYIEATVQYVDNTKYGKDLTKFSMVQVVDPGCACLSVSTKGFTPDVIERASATKIFTNTYEQLFSRFESFSPYVNLVRNSKVITSLLEAYEEPHFRDSNGEQLATSWLSDWKNGNSGASWLVVLGEYGTGKTALTLKLQSDWVEDYVKNPNNPIPFRIELRNFTSQFDARSLLHHFLDHNGLGHIPIDFVFHLIRSNRVLLILDGYDEMAQFLNARERRSCLAALADLASKGAKGILTSRPNYFTEAEELNVFEALYTSLEQNKYHMSEMDKVYVTGEKSIDELLERYLINRNERYLRDLSQDQTRALVRRKLANDTAGQTIVIDLLDKVFREEAGGTRQSLSGKPVIISYLLELVDDLRASSSEQDPSELTEWQIYKLIVDRLMMRDLQRSPTLLPSMRREALQKLALTLSKKEVPTATEEVFLQVINDLFRVELRRLSVEDRRLKQEELFQDLRSSATLTRAETQGASGWVFSHNSLREYLLAELCVGSMLKGMPLDATFPISATMRSFVAALTAGNSRDFLTALQNQWSKRQLPNLGAFITLSYDLLSVQDGGLIKNLARTVGKTSSGSLDFDRVTLKEIDLSVDTIGNEKFFCQANDASLVDINLRGADLSGSQFEGSTLDRVTMIGVNLSGANFKSSLIFECDFTGVNVDKADFSSLDLDSNFMVRSGDGKVVALSGQSAIGWLKHCGALTDSIPAYYELQHHDKFPIVEKICEHISDQRNSQLRGLTQRGAAQSDTTFARSFVEHLKNSGWIELGRNDLVTSTSEGRKKLTRLVMHQEMPEEIETFLRRH